MSSITIICLIHGDVPTAAFEVKIQGNESIKALKEAIRNKRPNVFTNSVDPGKLTLWKVNEPINNKMKFAQLKTSVSAVKDVLKGEELGNPTDKVKMVFGASPAKQHVHVIIKAPTKDKLEGKKIPDQTNEVKKAPAKNRVQFMNKAAAKPNSDRLNPNHPYTIKESGEIRDRRKNEQPVVFNRPTTELVYIFVNNSNFFVRGSSAVRRIEGLGYDHLVVDYGQLLKRIQGKCKLGDDPVIIGSNPSCDDSLWKSVEDNDYSVKVHQFQNNKKGGINEFFARKIDDVILNKTPGTLVLIAGDCNYLPVMTEAIKPKWKVETWSWNPETSNKDGTICMNLNTCYKSFTYGCGYESYDYIRRMKIKILEINGDTIRDEQIVEWLASLDLFCWIERDYEGDTIYLFFSNQLQLNKAKELDREES